ncbi:MAG: flagellar hook-associated protein FlgK [Rhodobacteraceae bacterium]|nr:MAG: flagellar hook-associated protein FlgK [Paracoccaceae bacterium]
MSFSGSISNALSGLRASSLAAELVSSNLANATNEDYAVRNISLSSRSYGGVQVDGVLRQVNEPLLGEWRRAGADTAGLETRTSYLARVDRLLGAPDEAGSLSSLMTRFESSLVSAAARPDLPIRQEIVLSSARDLAGAFKVISTGVQDLRTEIDTDIGRLVGEVNASLQQIVDLNRRIGSAQPDGIHSQSLSDLRQTEIDRISELVPLRVLPRDNGAVALVSTSGAVLLDGTAAELEFTASGVVTEHMTLQDDLVSGISIDGVDIPVFGDNSRLKGGRLAAMFELRDETLVGYQGEIDALARNLVERFQNSGLDPTIGAGDAGLLTDGGFAFAATDEVGISRRLEINAQVDPEAGGALWRLRDGLYAPAPGPSGDGALLLGMIDALKGDLPVASGSKAGLVATASELTSMLASGIATDLTQGEDRLSFASARSAELTEQRLLDGVDSDTELQKLMQIERAYAANAKVLQIVDEMLDVLMGVT